MNEYWQKQHLGEPLYPEIVWNKPEQKSLAGKLLIIGGNLHSINAPNVAYNQAIISGVGECKAVMPLSTRKFFGTKLPLNIEFLASNPSGSFGAKAYEDIMQLANWADGILFCGDVGKNSETSILLEELSKLNVPKTYVNDCIDPFIYKPEYILNDINSLFVLSFAQLQKISQNIKSTLAFTSNLEIAQIAEKLHLFTISNSVGIITEHNKIIYFAFKGSVITTKFEHTDSWSLRMATEASIWWLQNSNQKFKSVTTAISQVTF